jgi:hypothetical protein
MESRLVEDIDDMACNSSRIDWRPHGKKKNSTSFFFSRRMFKAPEGFHSNLATPPLLYLQHLLSLVVINKTWLFSKRKKYAVFTD